MINLQSLEAKLQIKVNDPAIFERSFIHKSYVNENPGIIPNERLEFLGDAVLELATTSYLFKFFPDKPEGELTALRSALVRGRNLAKVSEQVGLGEFLILSRGEENSGGRQKSYILANLCEAVIGAIYLDQGYQVAEKFILDHIIKTLDDILANKDYIDAKTKLQEAAQEHEGITPEYKLVSESGPDHDKNFTMGVYLDDKLIASGNGTSKQKAEQHAAQKALELKGWDKD